MLTLSSLVLTMDVTGDMPNTGVDTRRMVFPDNSVEKKGSLVGCDACDGCDMLAWEVRQHWR